MIIGSVSIAMFLGASIKVYVSELEDDGSLPSDHAFWTSYFSNENLSRHIYQGMGDLGAQYNINNINLNEVMSPIQPRVQTPSKIDHAAMQPFLAWMPVKRICKIFEKTTQFMRMPSSTYLCKCHHSANPAANVYQCWEADATDTIFSYTSAVDGGEKTAQLFFSCTTKLASVHPLKNTGEKALLGAFQDHVCWHGAPEEHCADNAQVYEGSFFMKYVCDLWIWLWQSESYYQQQNYVKNIWQSLKYETNCLIYFTGAATDLWFCALVFYCFI